MKEGTYITIQSWMRTELDLKGNDLLVYAIIFGFSQTEGTRFTGSLQYLADWCGATKQGILKNLKNLMDKGLIEKHEELKNGVNLVEYYSTKFNTPIKLSLIPPLNLVEYPVKLSLTNNIDNKIESNIDTYTNSISTKSQNFEFGNSKKPVKESRYSKCLAMIHDYTDDLELEELLITYMKFRLEIKDKPIYANQWKGLLNKLSKLSDNLAEKCDIVQQSIDRGYLSFFPISKGYSKSKDPSGEYGMVHSDSYDDEYRERQKKFREELERSGKQVKF